MTTRDDATGEQQGRGIMFRGRLDSTADHLTGMKNLDPTEAAAGVTDTELADWVAAIQDIRRKLSDVEHDLATVLGQRLGRFTGTLSDGRQFSIQRANDRKGWDHDEWKRDARRAITQEVVEGIAVSTEALYCDRATGEEVGLAGVIQRALTIAQEVHGSTAPRSGELKKLGLFASDYATSTPSGWRFTAVEPSDSEEAGIDG